MNRRLGIAVLFLLPLVLPAVVASCSSHPTVCAGPCGPPYEMSVTFHTGTSLATERAAVSACTSGNAVVLSVDYGTHGLGPDHLGAAMVETTELRTAKTKALLNCLKRSPSVMSAGWPS